MQILLAEDDALLGDALSAGLKQQGFQVCWVRDGVSAEQSLRSGLYAAAVLDLGLPKLDGIEALRLARKEGALTPVLILTARDAVSDRVEGLNLGADDYVVKPVDLVELGARLRALIRRAHGVASQRLEIASLVLDPANREVFLHERPITLTSREFDLLYLLMLNAGRVMTRDSLDQHLFGLDRLVESNALEVHLSHLRRKLGDGRIETIRGVGYRLRQGGRA